MIKLALGTVQFGIDYGISNTQGQIEANEAKKIMDLAYQSGIKSIDTATSYGNSEETLGDIGVSEFQVTTKLPSNLMKSKEIHNLLSKEVDSSLKRLKQDSIYGLLAHDATDLITDKSDNIFNALLAMKESKKVSKIGISAYSPDQIIQVVEKYDIDLVQAPLNIFDRRLVESGCLEYLNKRNIEVHTRSCFLQGLLLMSSDEIPSQFSNWKNLFREWHYWLNINNICPLQACLSYSLSIEGIHRVVIGIDSIKQLQEIIKKKDLLDACNIPNISSNDENLINPINWR